MGQKSGPDGINVLPLLNGMANISFHLKERGEVQEGGIIDCMGVGLEVGVHLSDG